MFLDASDAVLVRRFEAVRRPHPLQGDGTILDGIRLERARLAAVRESADIIIDTSAYNIHQLATQVADLFTEEGAARHTLTLHELRLQVRAAARCRPGRRHAVPAEPVLERGSAALTGEDDEVRDYVLAQEGAAEFLDAYAAALRSRARGVSAREQEPLGRRHRLHGRQAPLGGDGRSELAERLAAVPGVAVRVKHRDLGRE